MEQHPAIEGARNFLSTIWEGDAPDDRTVMVVLDRLIVAWHDTPDVHPTDSDLSAPLEDYHVLCKRIGARFPDYGYYPIADPIAELHGAVDPMLGDAIDDLVDLTLAMREVVWLEQNATGNDAISSFKTMFYHWGRHARELGLYLHARQFG